MALLALVFQVRLRHIVAGVYGRWKNVTVVERVAEYGPAARARLAGDFARIATPYPPAHLTLVALKAEKRLELWVTAAGGRPYWLKTYAILASTGHAGPKLRTGDRQTPEGVYRIESLNPNSLYHLALRVNYPNAADRRQAAADGRANPGGDIMIHGMDVSIGCIAIGDPAVEELFVLAAETGIENIDLLICPHDLRVQPPPVVADNPDWVPALYRELATAVRPFQQ